VKNVFRIAILTFFFVVTVTAADEQTGEWSMPVNGLKGRLIAKEDKPFMGTKMVAVYMELANVSDVGNPLEFYFDPTASIVSNVVDEKGEDVAQPPNAASIASPGPYWLAVPWDGLLRFRASVSGYGIYKNSGTDVQMMSGNWLIKPADKQNYYLQAKLVSRPPAADKRRSWSGELQLPRVLIPH
jgi:hypothetical protein